MNNCPQIQPPQPRPKANGFTLLELLVALSVFSILSLLAYASLGQFLRTQQQLEQEDNKLRRLQLAMQRLETDLQQSIDRPIRNAFGDPLAAFIGERQSIEFSRSGLANYQQQKRSDLQRVSWFIEKGQLFRADWQVLDRAQDSQARPVMLLSNIDEFSWTYIDNSQQAHEIWPPRIDTAVAPELVAVQCQFKSSDWGEIQRLFEVVLPPILEKPPIEAEKKPEKPLK